MWIWVEHSIHTHTRPWHDSVHVHALGRFITQNSMLIQSLKALDKHTYTFTHTWPRKLCVSIVVELSIPSKLTVLFRSSQDHTNTHSMCKNIKTQTHCMPCSHSNRTAADELLTPFHHFPRCSPANSREPGALLLVGPWEWTSHHLIVLHRHLQETLTALASSIIEGCLVFSESAGCLGSWTRTWRPSVQHCKVYKTKYQIEKYHIVLHS